jgi:hypothetical protein
MIRAIIPALLIIGCMTIYTRGPLSEQLLRVRTAYPGKLTNFTCDEYKRGECTKPNMAVYDLNDAAFRNQLNDFGFKCSIAGKRFRVCRDRPGFCQFTLQCEKHILFWCKKYKEIYIPASEHTYLINAKTTCERQK